MGAATEIQLQATVQRKPIACRKCGSPDLTPDRATHGLLCRACAKAAMIARYRREYADPVKHQIHLVRAFTRKCVRSGVLVRGACEACGLAEVQAHHDDYARPLAVRWLCRPHHARLHAEMRRAGRSPLPPVVGQKLSSPSPRNRAPERLVRASCRPRLETCKSGHPLEGDNLYVDPHGRPQCRQCRRACDQRSEAKRREKRSQSKSHQKEAQPVTTRAAARQSLAKAEALITRAHNGPADPQRRLVFPVSNRYCAASRFDFGDGLFKTADGKLLPFNSDMVIRAALKARQAVSAALAEAALRRAERPFGSSRSQPSGDAQDALPPSSQHSERVA